MGAGDGHHHPAGHLLLGHAQLRVHAGDDDVEPLEQVEVLVERAVLEDVDLHAGEDAERAPSSSLSASISSSCWSSRSRLRPWAIVSRGEWSVTTRYSWPSACAVRAITSVGAPPSLHERVAVAVALERGPQLGALADVDGGLVLELRRGTRRCRRRAPATMTLPVDGPMPGRSSSVPSAWCCATRRRRAPARGRAPWRRPAPGGPRPAPGRAGTRRGRGRRPGDMVASSPANLPGRNRVPVRGSDAVRPYPGGPYGAVRVRRSPQRREVVAVQRAGRRRRAGRALRLRHHRPERRRGPGPRPAPRRPRRDEPEPQRRAGHRAVRRHRRPGRRRQQGRGARQQVPQPHPRGRRHRVRAAGLRRRRRAGPVRSARAPRRRRARAHLRRPRDGREPDREAPQGGQGRQVAGRRGGGARAGQGRSSRPARRSTAPTSRTTTAGCSGRTSSSPTGR